MVTDERRMDTVHLNILTNKLWDSNEVSSQPTHSPETQITLSSNLAAVLGALQSTPCFTHRASKNFWNSIEHSNSDIHTVGWLPAVQLTWCVELDGRREGHSELLLQLRNHVHPLEGRSEVHLPHLLWVVFHRVILNPVLAMNLINHACKRMVCQ